MLLGRRDFVILLILLGVGVFTHVAALSYPREVIFDEVHFGKFITAYCCTGERFFDIHPPHTKLLIAGVAWLGGYRGGFTFEHIGQRYGATPVAALRALPAVMGTILPLVIYLLLRQLGATSATALLGGAATVLDNALTVQSRIIALDSTLLVATFGSLSAYLAGQATPHRWRWWYFVLAGALAGLAVGTKFTGLAAPALLGALVLMAWSQEVTAKNFRRQVAVAMILGASAVTVYGAGWVTHFMLLPHAGPGDAFHTPARLLPPEVPDPVSFFQETVTLHRVMFDANYHLTAGHPNASPWWSWPLMQMPVFYWVGGSAGLAQVYFVGNPAVWWGALLLFITALLVTTVQFGQRHRARTGQLWIPLLGYVIAMLPLVRVPRALFLYHYLTPLLFSLLFGLLWLERSRQAGRLAPARYRQIIVVAITVMLLGFILVSPLTYGIPLGRSAAEKDDWVHRILFWQPDPR